MSDAVPPMRLDSSLGDFDIDSAIVAGMGDEDSGARRAMFSAAAVAAALRLEACGIGPYPVRFLGRYVRAAGRGAALGLPEPLVGTPAVELVRGWLGASVGVMDGLAGDSLFAQWLDMVAALIAVRRRGRG